MSKTTTSQQQIQEIYEHLYYLSPDQKILFIDALFYQFTISGRAIWSDETFTDTDKAEAFKWLNELYHHIWNIKFDLQRSDDNESIKRLFGNIKFYGDQAEALRVNLIPTVLFAFDSFLRKDKCILPEEGNL